jgi:hypothetical protein
MVCQACGNQVAAEFHFCPRCGAPVTLTAAAPPHQPINPPIGQPVYPPMYAARPPRVQRNLQALGILWCVFGAYRVIAGIVGIVALRVMSERHFNHYGWTWHANFHGLFWPPWVSAFIPLVLIATALMAVLALIAGYGLLTRRPWGRVLGIVVGILALLKFPIGTALGIYTLWVLAPAQSGAEYNAIAEP